MYPYTPLITRWKAGSPSGYELTINEIDGGRREEGGLCFEEG